MALSFGRGDLLYPTELQAGKDSLILVTVLQANDHTGQTALDPVLQPLTAARDSEFGVRA
jgi:hypothetical protein